MKTISTNCNNCGACITVPPETKFLTCNYCKTQLQIEYSGDTFYTKIMGEIKNVAANVESIKHHSELERLDREWESTCQAFMIKPKNGPQHLPDAISTISLTIGQKEILASVTIWLILSILLVNFVKMSMLATYGLPIAGTVIIFLFGFQTMNRQKMIKLFEKAKQRHKSKRQELLKKLSNKH